MGDPKRGSSPDVATEQSTHTKPEQKGRENEDDKERGVVGEMRRNAEAKGEKFKDKLLNSEEAKQAESIIGKSRLEKMISNIVENVVEGSFVQELEWSSKFLVQRSPYVGGKGSPFIFETLVEAIAKLRAGEAWERAWISGADIGETCRMNKRMNTERAIEEGKIDKFYRIIHVEELEAETWQKDWQKKMEEAYQLLMHVLDKGVIVNK